MKLSRFGAALGLVAILSLQAAPAGADNYDAKDGNGIHQTFAAKLIGGLLHPFHVMEGMFGATPTPVTMTNSGALDTTCVAGCSSTADLRPASSTITVVDSGTAITTGQSSVSLITGTPTASSFQTQPINGYSSGSITVTGTFVATLAIEASYDGGTTYAPVSGLLRGTNITTASITGPAVVSLDVTGATHVRVRATAYTSGTATVKIAFSAAAGMTKVLNGVKLVDSTGANVDTSAAGSGVGAAGSAVPANLQYVGGNSSGNLTGIIQADASAKISISTNTITQVVALSAGKKIYVTNFNLHAAGTTGSKLVYGTGSNCGTGTTDLTDLYDLTASDGMVVGNGLGAVLIVPASNALCVFNNAAIHVGGSLAYTQF